MNPVGLRLAGGEVLLGPAGVHNTRAAVLLALDVHRVQRRPVPPELDELAALVGAAVIGSRSHAHRGSPGLPIAPAASSSAADLIDTKEAARMLGCGVRNVRDLVARGVLVSARNVGGRIRLQRTEVEAELRRREGARCA